MLTVDNLLLIPGKRVVAAVGELVRDNESTEVYGLNDLFQTVVLHLTNPRHVGVVDVMKVTFQNGSFVTVGKDVQFFLSNEQFKAASDLTTDDLLWSSAGDLKVTEAVPDGQQEVCTVDVTDGDTVLLRGWKPSRQSVAVKLPKALKAHLDEKAISSFVPFGGLSEVVPGTYLSNESQITEVKVDWTGPDPETGSTVIVK